MQKSIKTMKLKMQEFYIKYKLFNSYVGITKYKYEDNT